TVPILVARGFIPRCAGIPNAIAGHEGWRYTKDVAVGDLI
ncbi:MAG: hypothetical protein HW390_3088, partial [Candidatus Brocadiaceae bacterium]|nr:hypothetical protein [Candidatus Brocadiaceae bacterium]